MKNFKIHDKDQKIFSDISNSINKIIIDTPIHDTGGKIKKDTVLYFDGEKWIVSSGEKEDKKDLIPAVVHVDGTGRIQTVNEESNFKFYKLISEFYKITSFAINRSVLINIVS